MPDTCGQGLAERSALPATLSAPYFGRISCCYPYFFRFATLNATAEQISSLNATSSIGSSS
jgi:hypothetical protein